MRLKTLLTLCVLALASCSAPPENRSALGTVSPISVPYKFQDHRVNYEPQPIHFEAGFDSVNYYFTGQHLVKEYPGGRVVSELWPTQIVSSGDSVKYPSLKFAIPPTFPEIATRARIDGKVIAKVWVTNEGTPAKIVVVQSSGGVFDPEVESSLRQWKFFPPHPALGLKGAWAIIEFDFVFINKRPIVLMSQ